MERVRGKAAGWAAGGLVVAVGVWAVGAESILAGLHSAPREDYGTPYGDMVLSVAALSFALVGALVARRVPGHPVGWALLAAGVAAQVFGAADQGSANGAGSARPGPSAEVLAGVSARAAVVFIALVAVAIPLLFPDGRPLSARWRRLGWAGASATAAALVVPGLWPAVLAIGACAIVSCFLRYRRGDRIVRLQLRWLGMSLLFMVGSLVGLAVVGHELGRPTPDWFRVVSDISNILIAAVPVSVGVAVLKYRLWAVDVIADRALILLWVAGFTSAVYAAVVVGVGSAVGARGSVWLVVVATVIVAMALQPVRRSVQAAAHRLVYGRGGDPYEILSEFSRQVAGSPVGTEALVSCAHAAAVATSAAGARAFVRVGDQWQHVAAWPPGDQDTDGLALDAGMPDARMSVAVEQDGVVLGAISVITEGALSPEQRRLLGDVAAQSAILFRSVALDADLHRRLAELAEQAEELRSSRQRILSAEDSARRRIERDLHDGAQQRLVTLGISLARLRTRLPDDPHLLDQLDAASADLRRGPAELRELARGIHPALLSEAGLAEAVTALIERSAVAATLAGAPQRRYPTAVETTAYYVVAEALTNIAKHAPKATARVAITETGGRIVVHVTDDGPGGADDRNGTGLRGLRDRVASVGGTFTVRSQGGTEIVADLPCA